MSAGRPNVSPASFTFVASPERFSASAFRTMAWLLNSFVQPPDLLIYLRGDVPTLIKQIQKRGRDYESGIRLDYLTSLNQRYEDWIAEYNRSKLMILDVEEINFADNPEDLGTVINKIDAEFNSLFS